MECDPIMVIGALLAIPLYDGFARPLGILARFGMAAVAHVRRADLHRQIGPRHANAVIPPGVDSHVNGGRHMTGHALRFGRPNGSVHMMVVPRSIVLAGLVALRAETVAFV